MTILTREVLAHYIEDGLIESSRHPRLPLTIYNYSRRCQYESAWDPVTLQSRGLVMDDHGVIVARGFNKFFNYEELLAKDTLPVNDEYVLMQKKMDGSLGILFNYEGEWIMATRGSFISDQAQAGLQLAKMKYDLAKFDIETCYLCEIIYPQNRIVVDYGAESKVVFLSAIQRGTEVSWIKACSIFAASGIPLMDVVVTERSDQFGLPLYDKLKAGQIHNEEGFVVRFCPSGARLKIKFEEYVRLHRLLTNFSTVDVWEYLSRGNDIEALLDRVPDEFDRWVKDCIQNLMADYTRIRKWSEGYLMDLLGETGELDRKAKALWIREHVPDDMHSIVFLMLDEKRYEQAIWRKVKPEYAKPFWNQPED